MTTHVDNNTPLPHPATNGPQSPPPPPPLDLFEPPSRFSHSHLWSLNHSYYTNYGHLPFTSGAVPHFITSNAYTAHHTAQLILAHLLAHPTTTLPSPHSPLYIIEAGAGHGRHTFLTLQALSSLIADTAASSTARLPPWRYVCCDVSAATVDALRCHPSLQPFIHSHRLDFAVLSDESSSDSEALHCVVSGDVISRHTNRNPVLLTAAYTLSALACDAWQQRTDGLYEGRISLHTTHTTTSTTEHDTHSHTDPSVDRNDPQLLSRLVERWQWARVDNTKQLDTYYPPRLQSVFQHTIARLSSHYHNHSGSSSSSYAFLFPVSALLLLYRFLSLSHDQLTVVVLDKAHTMAADTTVDDSAVLRAPHIARHGSVSVMLSLLPLHIACESVRYGTVDTSGWQEGGFVASLLSTQQPTAGTVSVRLAFQRLKGLTPDGFSAVIRCVRDSGGGGGGGGGGLGVLCWLLRLAHHDCDVYYRVSHQLLSHLQHTTHTVSDKLRADLIRDCQHLMRNYYPLDVHQPLSTTTTRATAAVIAPLFAVQCRDVAFELGRLCLALSTHSAALLCFQCSWRDAGPHALTAYHLSMCEWMLGKHVKGREWLQAAERLAESDEEIEVLRSWRRTVDEAGEDHGQVIATNGAAAPGSAAT